MRRVDEIGEESRRRILDAAEELFGELLHENSLREQTYLCAAYAYQHAGQTRIRWLPAF